MIKRDLIILASTTLLTVGGCAGLKDLPKYQLKNDYYLFKQTWPKPVEFLVNLSAV
jgi:hypothetical protein